jgi:hypothetical protein
MHRNYYFFNQTMTIKRTCNFYKQKSRKKKLLPEKYRCAESNKYYMIKRVALIQIIKFIYIYVFRNKKKKKQQ